MKVYTFLMPDKEAIGNADFINNIPKQRGFLGVKGIERRKAFFFRTKYTVFFYDTLDNARKARNEFILNYMRVGNIFSYDTKKEND